ncbi:MAG: copper chaperone PCu(A)C [Nitrospirota bacterium]
MASRALIGVASAYLVIDNTGSGNDELTGCLIKTMPSVKCRLHDVIKGKMVPAEKIVIPAGRSTYLKKGSQHIMLYGIQDRMENEVELILNFKKSGKFNITAVADSG